MFLVEPVLSQGKEGGLFIGVCNRNVHLNGMPGSPFIIAVTEY